MKRLAFLTLALLGALAPAVNAKILVVEERTSTYSTNGFTAGLANKRVGQAVQAALARWGRKPGENFVYVSANAVTTEMARTGVLYKRLGGSRFDASRAIDTFTAVIHVGFNGDGTTAFSWYRPDSLTLTAAAPTVPQLMLIDGPGAADAADFTVVNSTTDSTWISKFSSAGSGDVGGFHEGEGSMWSSLSDGRTFGTNFGTNIVLKTGEPTGGIRPLLNYNANAVFCNLEYTGNMPTFPDSVGTAVDDTCVVYEKLNLHKSGAARITFASVGEYFYADSAQQAAGGGVNSAYDYQGINWVALAVALAHLDSLTNGDVLGGQQQSFGVVLVGAGTRSDRRHPGGIFEADTTILGYSCDSLRACGAKVVFAADPESLAVNAGDIAILKRAAGRFTPWVRVGMDTTVAGLGNASTSRVVDVFGRYRNRAIFGDSLRHAVPGADTSVAALWWAARKNLASLVGESNISNSLVAPGGDWTPFQIRRNQNAGLVDSLLWMANLVGAQTLVFDSYGQDMLPTYLTNPKGWPLTQGTHAIGAASARGVRVKALAYSGFTPRGSRVGSRTDGLSFLGWMADTIPPVCSPGPCPNPSATAVAENHFWNAYFGPSRDLAFDPYDGLTDELNLYDNYPALYKRQRASVLVLPVQSLGGQSVTAPNRWGFFTIRHLVDAAKLINAAAGRTVISNEFVENVNP